MSQSKIKALKVVIDEVCNRFYWSTIIQAVPIEYDDVGVILETASLLQELSKVPITIIKKNAIYYDTAIKETKSTCYFVIDKAHYSSKISKAPFATELLSTHSLLYLLTNNSLMKINKNNLLEIILNKLFLTYEANALVTIITLYLKEITLLLV